MFGSFFMKVLSLEAFRFFPLFCHLLDSLAVISEEADSSSGVLLFHWILIQT